MGYVERLEFHHARVRQMGLTRLRSTVLWDEDRRGPDYHWLDWLQAVGYGQTELVINDYGLLEWIDEAMFWNGCTASVMHELACQITRCYRGAFRSYNVGVKLGTGPIRLCGPPEPPVALWWPQLVGGVPANQRYHRYHCPGPRGRRPRLLHGHERALGLDRRCALRQLGPALRHRAGLACHRGQ